MRSAQKYSRNVVVVVLVVVVVVVVFVVVVVVVVVVVEALLVNSLKHSSTKLKPAQILKPNGSICAAHCDRKTQQ
jgi:hypothetical protein